MLPRPRRFGKSLFISMLSNFFDIEKKKENVNLFENLYISKTEYYKELCSYLVIYLNFKDLKSDNFEETYNLIKNKISNLYLSKDYIE